MARLIIWGRTEPMLRKLRIFRNPEILVKDLWRYNRSTAWSLPKKWSVPHQEVLNVASGSTGCSVRLKILIQYEQKITR